MSLPRKDISVPVVSAVEGLDNQAPSVVSKMPLEIITDIFMLALPLISDADDGFTSEPAISCFGRKRCILRAVCRQWCGIIDNTPLLWKIIVVDRTTTKMSSLESQLVRSQACPIDVFVLTLRVEDPPQITDVLRRLQPHLHRVRLLSLLFDNSSITKENVSSFVQSTFPPNELTKLPYLEVLELHLAAQHDASLSFGRLYAPKLRHFRHTSSLTRGLTTDTANSLTKFHFNAVESDLEPWELLSISKNVEYLEIMIGVVPSLDKRISLPRLHTLNIVFPMGIHQQVVSTTNLGQIYAPSIYQIHITVTNPPDNNPPISTFDVPSLIRLFNGDFSNVVILSITGARLHNEVDSLLRLLNNVTQLTLTSCTISSVLLDELSDDRPKDKLRCLRLRKIVLEYCRMSFVDSLNLFHSLKKLGVETWRVEDYDGRISIGNRCGYQRGLACKAGSGREGENGAANGH